jgi:hypothetical protein
MTQLTIDVPDDIAEQFKQQAAQAGLSLSRYVMSLIQKPTASELDQHWLEIAEKRVDGYLADTVQAIPAEQVFEQLRQKHQL